MILKKSLHYIPHLYIYLSYPPFHGQMTPLEVFYQHFQHSSVIC